MKPFSRARYITICQQFLVTAAVAAVGLSAAGVMTLNIVSPEAPALAGPASALGLAPAVKVSEAYVATAPITPVVREVKVAPLARPAAATPAAPAAVAPRRTARAAAPAAGGASKPAGLRLAAESAPTTVHGYATVGVTWQHGVNLAENQIAVQVRTLKNGVWSAWQQAQYHDEHGPDSGTAEARKTRPGTDAVVIGDVNKVQMRAETSTGIAPPDLELAVIDPGTGSVVKAPAAINTADLPASDSTATSAPPIEATVPASGSGSDVTGGATAPEEAATSGLDLAAMKIAPKPVIYSRAQWGANESMRDPSSLHYGTIETGFIHHTVNANNYTPDQVPALIRGIYAYHTQTRGWSDIGYNFLVDRFGRIWEGRYGGVDRPVVGAHTLGYNEYSFAMSAIGNFDVVQPPQVMLNAYAALFAWKLSLSNIRADATHLWVKDRYVNAINGHRDVNQTECPGRYLYAKIPSIRIAAQKIQDNGIPPTDPADLPLVGAPAGTPLPTTTPTAAVPQPALNFPARTSLISTMWPDLITKSSTGQLGFVPTTGMAGFAAPVYSRGPWSGMSMITAVGDVTGDGHGDILAKSQKSGYARIFTTDGLGHVSPKGIDGTYAFQGVNQIIAATDFDHDGHNDVLARDRKTTALELFRGLGNGTFAAPVVLRRTWPYERAAAVDLNRDGNTDLVALRSDNSLMLIPGKGGLTPGTSFGAPQVMTKLSAPITGLFAGNDATGDRRKDLMVRWSGSGLTTLYAGTGTATLGQAWGPFNGLAALTKVSAAQMVGSQAADVVGMAPDGTLAVVPENGRLNIGTPVVSNLSVPGATEVLNVGDWDRNGTGDVITREQGGDRLVLRPGLGNGKFGRGRSLGNGWKTITRLAAVGDVTGDGYPDLIGKTATGPMTIFPGYGNKAFKAPQLAPASLRTYNQIGSAAWSPRGSAFVSTVGTFVPLVGTDPGTALRTANGTADPTYDTYVGVGDVNGDGVADLLAREQGSGTIWMLPGKTSGGFAPRVWVANGFAGYQLIG